MNLRVTNGAMKDIEKNILRITDIFKQGKTIPEEAFQLGTIYEKLTQSPESEERNRLILMCDDLIMEMNHEFEEKENASC